MKILLHLYYTLQYSINFAGNKTNKMFKSIRFGAIALVSLLTFASCGDDASDVRDQAREAVTSTTDAVANTANDVAKKVEQAVPAGPTTVMTFDETQYNFGEVKEGEKVKHVYKFKNTGDEPLVLSNAKGSCGCTVPSWPKEPIAPGASGEIIVEFNSKGKGGDRNQKVTITANTQPAQTVLNLVGKVIASAKKPATITQ